MAERFDGSVSKGAAIIGSSVAAIQVALTLARMGVEVQLITESVALGCDGSTSTSTNNFSRDRCFIWPLMLQASSHPLITLHTNAKVESIEGEKGNFNIQVVQFPRYVHEDLCTGCSRCQAECSAKVTSLLGGQKITHSAIHTPLIEGRSIPSAYVIDKNGFAPCQAACPLGINVQGFISLLANGKTDRALALINEAAPLNGILGRVCRHPCEDNCNRGEVDNPVFIRALHRYTADNASGGIKYTHKVPARSREGKIAIVGSGPAGLTAAWELTRLGYSPTVFESHGVIGGMLATGIPRFRLPREVREREMEAIKNLGIDIRTGITAGRDVTFTYLKERGYRAFFLSIGAQLDNKLKIPGEELDGVVDCMSLLLTLNLKVDTFVGQNVVVIGDGNSAIDSARAAIRRNKGRVTVLSWTTPEEITAAADEVEEALQERVAIKYHTIPVEILGEAGRVTGVRCQRTRLTEGIMGNGRHMPEPLPGTDFVIQADHIVVAVGQVPNASQLNMENLAIDGNTGVIQANPLTLETSIHGVFAGGDCVTGPNNVVEAMAAGLRAADSIDRYIRGQDLEAGRSLEPTQPAEIDIETVEASPDGRATMPTIRLRKRLNSFEETTTGLSFEAAQRESRRCLDCALCSQCMECTRVCELDAVFHDDGIRHFEVGSQVILRFPNGNLQGSAPADNRDQETTVEGIRIFPPGVNEELARQVVKAMAIALETAIEIKPKKERKWEELKSEDSVEFGASLGHSRGALEQVKDDSNRTGVFLCRCGGSISSVIDFKVVARKLSELPGIIYVREIAQACTEAGAREIESQLAELQLDRVVLAACRCCNLNQVCYSCTDRRMMCQEYLNQYLISPYNTIVEFVNIREQCAWLHKDEPQSATRKAVQIISSGVSRVRLTTPVAPQNKSILPGAIIIGGEPASISAARALASQGYRVYLVARTVSLVPGHLKEREITVMPWPDVMELHGTPGNYEAMLKYDSRVECVPAGAVLVDIKELNRESSPPNKTTFINGLLGRILSRRTNSEFPNAIADDFLREVTIKEAPGIFLLAPDGAESLQEQAFYGLAAAARVSTYLEQASISPQPTAVNIDSKLCRGCGNCADICPYIEIKKQVDGTVYASVDKALCLGCGACIASCPTGAITQPLQSDKQIISTLRSMIHTSKKLVEV